MYEKKHPREPTNTMDADPCIPLDGDFFTWEFYKHDVCILKVQDPDPIKRNPKDEGWKRLEMESIE